MVLLREKHLALFSWFIEYLFLFTQISGLLVFITLVLCIFSTFFPLIASFHIRKPFSPTLCPDKAMLHVGSDQYLVLVLELFYILSKACFKFTWCIHFPIPFRLPSQIFSLFKTVTSYLWFLLTSDLAFYFSKRIDVSRRDNFHKLWDMMHLLISIMLSHCIL